MQTRMIVLPNEDGFTVLVWGTWAQGSMRMRRFTNRAAMITLLETLRLINPEQARELDHFDFVHSCPLYSSEVDDEALSAHGFGSVL